MSVVRSRGWAGGLPALIVLLLVLGGGTCVVRRADATPTSGGGAVLGTAVAVVQPASAAPRADARPLAKRGGKFAPGTVVAAGCPSSGWLVPPIASLTVAGSVPVAFGMAYAERCRGRAPPFVV